MTPTANPSFSGETEECLEDFVAEYDLFGRAFDLSKEQKLRYLHYFLKGDAKRFYLSEQEPFASSYADAVSRICAEYYSAIYQSQAQNTLGSLRIATYVANGKTEQDALVETYWTVAKVSKFLPPLHQGQAHRMEYLRGAVVGDSWACQPLSRIATARLGFQHLYGEFQSALSSHDEANRAVLQNSVVTTKPATTTSETRDVLYGGQRWYATNPAVKDGNVAGEPSGRLNALSLMGCFTFDKPDHAAKDCPAPNNGSNQDSRRQQYFYKRNAKRAAVTTVL